ncbi:MAG: divergent PAP2 family protein [Lachnospiraceae bacterium]|nr:divergent PAP2 family protein [Lachnospiraceae bacterium]
MSYIIGWLTNEMIVSAATGWISAQIIKTIIHLIKTKDFNPERLYGTGGMPSSHSATVAGLGFSIAINYGTNGPEFALAFILAVVVCYDALGIRRQAGYHAIVLNQMVEEFKKEGKEFTPPKPMKTTLGHSFIQVLAGIILGAGIAFLLHFTVFAK